jgi:hypothetical protein
MALVDSDLTPLLLFSGDMILADPTISRAPLAGLEKVRAQFRLELGKMAPLGLVVVAQVANEYVRIGHPVERDALSILERAHRHPRPSS